MINDEPKATIVDRSTLSTSYSLDRQTLLLIVICNLLMIALFSRLELAARFLQWGSRYPYLNLDVIVAVLIGLTVSSAFFFWLRSRALQDEVARRLILEQQLHFQTNHDALTGLPNRQYFLEALDQLLKQPRSEKTDVVVLFLDLDGFKVINDSSGHEAGDSLLLAVGRRLQCGTDEQAVLARLGGDEFAILLNRVANVNQVLHYIQRIQLTLKEPLMVGDCEVVVTTSIGVAFASDTNWSASDLLRNADAAMYAAKQRGKSAYEFFDKEMNVKARTHLSLESELRQAIRQQQFRVYYQPIFHLLTNRVVGLEALVRWQHPQRGILTPDHFLDVAEASGLMGEIGDFVFFEACRQVNQWRHTVAHYQTLQLSINLSPRQFQHPAFVKQAADIIHQTAFPAEQLHLEIIENMAMQNTDVAAAVMRQLQTLGVNMALDDFGTGYSSLAYLRRFPLNGLKIDRSFVMELERRAENLNIVRAIIALTKALGLAVTAEGIETAAQLSTLSALGCTYGQGFYFAKPMPAEAMGPFLEDRYNGGQQPINAQWAQVA